MQGESIQFAAHVQAPSIPQIAAIILNWRDAAATLRCLDSLRSEILAGKISAVVCDNASGDELESELRSWVADRLDARAEGFSPKPPSEQGRNPGLAPAMVMIQTGRNGGYAYGNNCGLRLAMDYPQFEWLWILNNDTVVEPGSVDALLSHAAAKPRAGAIGSTVLEMDDASVVECAGGFRYFPGLAVMRAVGKGMDAQALLRETAEGSARLDYIYGAAMLLRTDALRRIGLLSEEYFLYYEELDLARRLEHAGFLLSWCAGSRVRHRGGSSALPESMAERQYHEQLSALRFTRRHHPALLPMVLVLRLIGKPLAMFVRGKRRYIPAAMRAARDFFLLGQAPRSGV